MKKIAVVTGSRRGIGLGIALKLLDNGFFVVLSGTAESENCVELFDALAGRGNDYRYIRCDISKKADRENLINVVEAECGAIDLLVNNAGIAPKTRMDVLETTEESFDELMSVNLKGTFFMCQAGANSMIKAKKKNPGYTPRIINISSVSAYASTVNRGEYCISKAGISMTTTLFADRMSEFDIPVFEIRPGIILTDMTAAVKDKYERMISSGLTPTQRFGMPEDIGKCVAAIAQGDFDFSTGQVFNLDGGFSIRRL